MRSKPFRLLVLATLFLPLLSTSCKTASIPASLARTERPKLPGLSAELTQTERLEPISVKPTGEVVTIDRGILSAITTTAAAVGLKIVERNGYSNKLSGNLLSIYLEIDPDMRGSALFNGGGVSVPIELLITTSATPPRIKQRSFLVRIANQ